MASNAAMRSTANCVAMLLWIANYSLLPLARKYNVSRGFARYWHRRLVDPSFHPGSLGGARHVKFTPVQEAAVLYLLWQELLANPLRTTQELAQAVVIFLVQVFHAACAECGGC